MSGYTALIDSIPPNRLLAIEPATFGFGTVEDFFEFGSPVLGVFHRWILPILASEIMSFFWQETMGARPLATNSHEVFERIGNLPIRIPRQDYQDRLGRLVQLVHCLKDVGTEGPG